MKTKNLNKRNSVVNINSYSNNNIININKNNIRND